jgi:hypothetical protein
MSTCSRCGEEIEFRHVDGKIVPIHVNGGWCQADYNSNSWNSSYDTSRSCSFDDFCRKTSCAKCGQDVFFIRHNGGSLWVDSLGWPWPKHSCMDNSHEPAWYTYFNKNNYIDKNSFVGVVIKCVWRLSQILLAVDGGEQGRIVLSTEGNTTADYFKNTIIIANFGRNFFVCSNHDKKPIFSKNVNPELLGLPKNWVTRKK